MVGQQRLATGAAAADVRWSRARAQIERRRRGERTHTYTHRRRRHAHRQPNNAATVGVLRRYVSETTFWTR